MATYTLITLIIYVFIYGGNSERPSIELGPISLTVWANEDGQETVVRGKLINLDDGDGRERIAFVHKSSSSDKRQPKVNKPTKMKCRGPRAIISGDQQSPIDISTSSTSRAKSCEPLRYINFEGPKKAKITNTGETVDVELINSRPAIYIESRPDVYYFQGFHFHWGGAEHLMDGEDFAGEIHMVFFNELYPNETMAKECTNGVMTFAMLLQLSLEDNPYLEPIIKGVGKVPTAKSKATLSSPLYLRGLFPECLSKYYYYFGSFTTPPFYESVAWIVFEEPVFLSKRQLARFRTMREGRSSRSPRIMRNIREIQPVADREIFSTTHCPCY